MPHPVISTDIIGQCWVIIVTMATLGDLHFGLQGQFILAYPHQEAVTLLAQSQNNFTRDLYTQLTGGTSGNLFFSPFSVMAALSMTYCGTGGKTQQQISSVMHLHQSTEDLHNAFHDLLTDIKRESPDYELRSSNMAYISDKLTVLSHFASTLEEKYLSSFKTVDFSGGEAVRQDINSVVEKETNSRIKDLIPQGMLSSQTRMVLVNAVYFKGLWEHQFEETATNQQDFWTSKTESVKVPMMHINHESFRTAYRQDLEATLLAMDYKGSKLSMILVLPTEREGLVEVEAKLGQMDLLNTLHQDLHLTKIQVALPRFKLEESMDLISHLQDMGMKDLFDESSCDLSGISECSDLYVSQVLHKAFLEVNEKGSEAAAATGVVMRSRSMPMMFTVDHPFLFYIRDEQSGLLLFAGRLTNPGSLKSKDEL